VGRNQIKPNSLYQIVLWPKFDLALIFPCLLVPSNTMPILCNPRHGQHGNDMPMPAMPCTHCATLAPLSSSIANLIPLLPLASLNKPMLVLVGEEHRSAGNAPCPRRPVMPGLAWTPPTGTPGHAPAPSTHSSPGPRVCLEPRHSTRDTPEILSSPTVAHRRRRRNRSPPRPHRTSHAPDRVRHRPAAPLPPGEPPGHAEQHHALA
jgi:hypothetical protein